MDAAHGLAAYDTVATLFFVTFFLTVLFADDIFVAGAYSLVACACLGALWWAVNRKDKFS